MSNLELLFLVHIVERAIIIVIGGLSIYLGYRLFRAVKTTGEGTAEVKLPGDTTVMVSRVGPGVFFALFGAVVTGASLAFPIHFSEQKLLTDGSFRQTEFRQMSGMGELSPSSVTPAKKEELEGDRLRVKKHISFLNQLPQLLNPTLSEAQRKSVNDNILAMKLNLIQGVWGEDWGSFEDFQLWAEGGAKEFDSEAFRKAKEFFTYGQEKP